MTDTDNYRVVLVKGRNTTPKAIKKMDEVIKEVNPNYFLDVNDEIFHCEEPNTAMQIILPTDEVMLFDFD